MEANKTWSIVPLLEGKHTLRCRWVYKVKYLPDGTIDKYKACLVTKEYTQQDGLDFIETFSPVAKVSTIPVLLTLVAVYKWSLL